MENKEIRLINLHRLLRETKTAAALAYAAGTSPSYISQVLSKKNKGSIGNKLARRLEIAASKPRGWLDLLHDGEEHKFTDSAKDLLCLEFDKVLNWYSGKGLMPKKTNHPMAEAQTLGDLNNTNVFHIEVTGDAMVSMVDISSSICPGDIATVNCNVTPAIGDIVLFKIKQTVKIRQLAKDGNEQILKASNPQYSIIPFTNQTKILGVVVEIKRKIKK